jgi:disulfide bond formation protein DsbB
MLAQLLQRWPLAALIASALMLAAAHAFQTFGHLTPCMLCLRQREVYWAAMALAAAGVGLSFTPWRGAAVRIVCALLALAFLWGAGLALYHAGAEWKWWPGPASCSAAAVHVSAADLAAVLRGGRMSAPACDKAPWVFLGLSMAGWNALISLALALASALAAARRGEAAR